ncbi:MAG TPA: SpoIIE family protein phosphatase [Candidatus Sulfopaludibacter sp.]|jgi:sigma-B regulation protein RsbU (phosphoserine phosphatase)|nr:SpoIIE family protein phosphatase [Candidatus Sulfopaludibacter sp.]
MVMCVTDTPGVAAKPKPFRVLVCDDQHDVLEAMRLLLKGQGFQAVTVDSPKALLNATRNDSFDLILADLNYTRDTTSGAEGLDLLASLDQQGNATPVVVMTAWGSVDLAVEAMRRGACDFIQKPWDNARVISVIRKQADTERRRKSEMEIAANVQQKLFPKAQRAMKTIDFAGECRAAREVGGDYYDFLEIDDHTIGFVLGDVSGKGVPAALLMANLQACFRSQTPASLLNPAVVLKTVNRHFFDSTAAERFATLFFAIYDDRTRGLRYVNCGHLSPLLLRMSGEVERLLPTATMLGAFRTWGCTESSTELFPGDTLLMYSDGVTEAGMDDIEEYGEDRLVEKLRQHQFDGTARMVQAIQEDVAQFSPGARGDDVTVVALRGV